MKLLVLIVTLVFTMDLWALDIKYLLNKYDSLYRSKSSHSIMKMVIKTPYWKRSVEIEAWTKGMDYSLMRILKPKKDRGISTLKRKSEMWNYFPKIDKIIKVPPSMMMGSWMGSDFTNDDLVRESKLEDDYTFKLISEDKDSYLIELKPNKELVTIWGKIELKVSKSGLPISQLFFDEKGRKARLMAFDDLKIVDGKKVPMRMTLTPLKKKGHVTIIQYSKLNFNTKNSETRFSKRNLKN